MTVPFVDLKRLLQPHRAAILAGFERVLDSGRFVQDAEVRALEAEACEAFESPFAVATSNGTTALQLALEAAGVGPGDEVITVANTFIATAEAIVMAGATPVFVDIEESGFNIDAGAVARAITQHTRAIIPVHLYGRVADMALLKQLALAHDVALIEDACQAHGAVQGGRLAGAIAPAGCLSFYPTKNVGTVGEGGMLLTSDAQIAEVAASLRDHGQCGRHNHTRPGYNYRMPELQAAALRAILPNLGDWNGRRIEAAGRYRQLLGSTPLGLVADGPLNSDVSHLFVVRTSERAELRGFLGERGIETAIHYPTPIHLQPAFEYLGYGRGALPRTEHACAEILSLPLHPCITEAEIKEVCVAVEQFFAQPHQLNASTRSERHVHP